jgi:glycosyltransferase involved in cell wall biosynthesis
MRILITVDPEVPVPPRFYGGIERVVDFLIDGLLACGFDITLLANSDSRSDVTLLPWPQSLSSSRSATLQNLMHAWKIQKGQPSFDLVHSFSRQVFLLPFFNQKSPIVQSYQRHISKRSVRLGNFLSRSRIVFTACSSFLADQGRAGGGAWKAIPNGIKLENYHFSKSVPRDAPLVFLGRLDRIKGAHIAMDAASRAGRRLIIAGNHAKSGPEADYFNTEIFPRLSNPLFKYAGPVDDAAKNQLLGGAAALLFPIEWEEPFGIVMAEALACGTPILGFARGAVPEVIRNGVTGFISRSLDEMTLHVSRIADLDRNECRKDAETRFSDNVIVRQYRELYQEIVSRNNSGDELFFR